MFFTPNISGLTTVFRRTSAATWDTYRSIAFNRSFFTRPCRLGVLPCVAIGHVGVNVKGKWIDAQIGGSAVKLVR